MKKFTYYLLSFLELIKACLIISTNKGFEYTKLPLAWFYAVPFIFAPYLLLSISYILQENKFFVLYGFTKIFNIISAFSFIILTKNNALTQYRMHNESPLFYLFETFIFLIIDSLIILAIVFKHLRKKSDNNIDNENSTEIDSNKEGINADNSSC